MEHQRFRVNRGYGIEYGTINTPVDTEDSSRAKRGGIVDDDLYQDSDVSRRRRRRRVILGALGALAVGSGMPWDHQHVHAITDHPSLPPLPPAYGFQHLTTHRERCERRVGNGDAQR